MDVAVRGRERCHCLFGLEVRNASLRAYVDSAWLNPGAGCMGGRSALFIIIYNIYIRLCKNNSIYMYI